MPPSLTQRTCVALGTAVLATGVLTTLQPPRSSAQQQRAAQQHQRQIDQLSSADEREHQRVEQAGETAGQADYERRLVPVEPRPARPRLRLVPR